MSLGRSEMRMERDYKPKCVRARHRRSSWHSSTAIDEAAARNHHRADSSSPDSPHAFLANSTAGHNGNDEQRENECGKGKTDVAIVNNSSKAPIARTSGSEPSTLSVSELVHDVVSIIACFRQFPPFSIFHLLTFDRVSK